MIILRSNKETLHWLKEISWRGMTQEKLTGEADSYFGVVKTIRPETVRAKILDFMKKEDNLRQSLKFQIMRARNGEGPRGRNPPLSFRLKDVTVNGFISVIIVERESDYKCEICGTLLLGKDNCEKHLRSEHFKEFKSLFARKCSSEADNHVTYKKWDFFKIEDPIWNLLTVNICGYFHTCLIFPTHVW